MMGKREDYWETVKKDIEYRKMKSKYLIESANNEIAIQEKCNEPTKKDIQIKSVERLSKPKPIKIENASTNEHTVIN